MNIDSSRPATIEGPSPSGPVRPLLPAAQNGQAQPHPAVREPAREVKQGLLATDETMHELVEVVEPFNVSLKFTRDAETGTIVVEMIDQKSGETLQQFPNAARLQIAANLTKLQGKILNVQA